CPRPHVQRASGRQRLPVLRPGVRTPGRRDRPVGERPRPAGARRRPGAGADLRPGTRPPLGNREEERLGTVPDQPARSPASVAGPVRRARPAWAPAPFYRPSSRGRGLTFIVTSAAFDSALFILNGPFSLRCFLPSAGELGRLFPGRETPRLERKGLLILLVRSTPIDAGHTQVRSQRRQPAQEPPSSVRRPVRDYPERKE